MLNQNLIWYESVYHINAGGEEVIETKLSRFIEHAHFKDEVDLKILKLSNIHGFVCSLVNFFYIESDSSCRKMRGDTLINSSHALFLFYARVKFSLNMVRFIDSQSMKISV